MQPLFPSRRLFIVSGVMLTACLAALLVHNAWRRSHPSPDTYQRMVSAFGSGVAALDAGDDAAALSGLTTATRLVPQEPAAWADLGLLSLRQRHSDQARQALEKALDLAPRNGQILTLMGILEMQRGRLGEAVEDDKQAVLVDPSDLRARYALAQALQQQGGPKAVAEAREQMEAIYEAAPDNLFAEFLMADAAAKAGDAAGMRRVMAKIAAHSSANALDRRTALAPLRGLQNELARTPQYQEDAAKIQGNPHTLGTPIKKFLVLPAPPD